MEFSQEQIEKAKKAKTAEELLTIAKEEGINLSKEQAEMYFKIFNTTTEDNDRELAEEELNNVAGGSCYSKGVDGPHGFKKYLITTAVNTCDNWWTDSPHDFRGCCSQCDYHFSIGITMYCSERTKDHDPYK